MQKILKNLSAIGTGGMMLVIPASLRDELKFSVGQKVLVSTDGKKLTVEAVPIEKKKRIVRSFKKPAIPIISKPPSKTTPTAAEK